MTGTGTSAGEVAEALALRPHREGGFFRETYRAPATIGTDAGERCLATSIIYLLTAASPSRLHRLRSDEIWFYHAGCRAELAMLMVDGEDRMREPSPLRLGPCIQAQAQTPAPARSPDGERSRLRLDLLGPERPQVFVPGGWLLGVRVADDGPAAGPTGVDPTGGRAGGGELVDTELLWTLVGCVVTPGFEYEDFELAEPGALLREFPEAADIIKALT